MSAALLIVLIAVCWLALGLAVSMLIGAAANLAGGRKPGDGQ